MAIAEPLQKAWETWVIKLVDVTPGQKERPILAVENYLEKPSPLQKTEYISGFREDGHSYTVEIELHAFVDISPAEQESSRKAALDGSGLTIRDTPRR